jgi:hypothetical protein
MNGLFVLYVMLYLWPNNILTAQKNKIMPFWTHTYANGNSDWAMQSLLQLNGSPLVYLHHWPLWHYTIDHYDMKD